MGSSGTGRISDYPGSAPKRTGGGGISGGSSGEDRCDKAFSTELEDFQRSDYWKAHGSAPDVGTEFDVFHEKRIVARTAKGESLGFLPTEFNYLAGCIAEGRTYKGHVVSVTPGLLPRIQVDVGPTK